MEIKPGMIVWDVSGGPKMSVKGKHHITGHWDCTWFEGTEIKQWRFHPDQLTDVDPNMGEEVRSLIGYRTNSNSDTKNPS